MENNYERMRMPELRALAKRDGLRGYSKLRKDDLIALLRRSNRPTWEPLREDEPASIADVKPTTSPVASPVTGPSHPIKPNKNRLKQDARRRTKTKKESIRLRNEINKLETQMDEIKGRIKKIVHGAHSAFKKEKIRNMN